VSEVAPAPTGEGAGRNTRGRVCSPKWTELLRPVRLRFRFFTSKFGLIPAIVP
jgi:hypothetical protein